MFTYMRTLLPRELVAFALSSFVHLEDELLGREAEEEGGGDTGPRFTSFRSCFSRLFFPEGLFGSSPKEYFLEAHVDASVSSASPLLLLLLALLAPPSLLLLLLVAVAAAAMVIVLEL